MKLLDSVSARARAVDPFRADVLLAAAFVVAAAIELPLLDPEGHERAPTIVAGLIAVAGLAYRRRDPLLAAAIFAVPTVSEALLDGYLTSNSTVPFVAAIFLLYSTGRYAGGRRLWAAALLATVAMLLALWIEGGVEGADFFWAAFLFGLPLLAGRALRSRTLLQAELREKAEREEGEREWRAAYAVEEERERIATELQTLVANGLSAMVVQAETVPRLLGSGETAAAGNALAAVEATGRDALTEMRRLLDVLRRGGERAERTPQPGYRRILALVERTRERGLPVEFRVEGQRRYLSPGVDLTVYRVLEDALEAAAEKGATSADLLIRFSDDQLQLQVTDDRDGGTSDRMPGLRERVGLYGGHLSAGPLEDGAFRLRATVPVEGAG